jgi:hypothetical protein
MNEQDIKRRKLKAGYQISCRKQLWRVIASDQQTAEREAAHYWFQYFSDGEYDD